MIGCVRGSISTLSSAFVTKVFADSADSVIPCTGAVAGVSWPSPKRAIDGDLIHDALEDSQLFLVESRDKKIGDPAQVDRRRLGQAGHARLRQYDHDTTSVCIGVDATDEAFVNQSRGTASHARPRYERPGREVGHAQLATRERQLSEHVEISQGHASLLFEIHVELAHE